MKTMVLKVEGMSCNGCVTSVTKVLQALSGVAAVEVSLEKGEAVVGFEESQLDREAMIAAIDDAGFRAY